METSAWDIDRREALRYAGYHGVTLPEEALADFERCAALIKATARPRTVWKLFRRREDGTLSGTDFRPEGRDIAAHLAGCHSVVLLAATLGAEVDALLRRTQLRDMATAVLLDGCASAGIESVCDALCGEIAAALAPDFLTDRFSPGYGDFPLAQQEGFCRLLELPKRIGVTLSPGGLLLPQKTVTAALGVADTPRPTRIRGCGVCPLAGNCAYRKEGKSCGNF